MVAVLTPALPLCVPVIVALGAAAEPAAAAPAFVEERGPEVEAFSPPPPNLPNPDLPLMSNGIPPPPPVLALGAPAPPATVSPFFSFSFSSSSLLARSLRFLIRASCLAISSSKPASPVRSGPELIDAEAGSGEARVEGLAVISAAAPLVVLAPSCGPIPGIQMSFDRRRAIPPLDDGRLPTDRGPLVAESGELLKESAVLRRRGWKRDVWLDEGDRSVPCCEAGGRADEGCSKPLLDGGEELRARVRGEVAIAAEGDGEVERRMTSPLVLMRVGLLESCCAASVERCVGVVGVCSPSSSSAVTAPPDSSALM